MAANERKYAQINLLVGIGAGITRTVNMRQRPSLSIICVNLRSFAAKLLFPASWTGRRLQSGGVGPDLFRADEVKTTLFWCQILGGRPWVFAATWRPYMVDRATAQPLIVETQEGARIGELAAGAATVALTLASGVNR
ncbi:hypothetical protein [Candidatus Thiodictyon syntrophicum]|uniref:hypothetical protein n=1 Tax=Candidatus Thiodictyon syntrophicum TaxID=1166950 RepID=UPI0012FE2CF8|nr:hypothetical protein [Candidatus Thiodictyon syntrophicum]